MNRVHIVPTKFENVRTGETTLGWRAFDDEAQSYDNTWDDLPADDLEFLKRVLNSHDAAVESMLEWVINKKDGLFIGDNWYTWRKIKPLLVEADLIYE